MFLDLERLPPEGEAVDRTLDARGLAIDGQEFRLLSDVQLKGWIQPVDSGGERAYRLEGSMSCRIEVPCVRCLEPFLMDIQEKMDLLYLPQSQNVAPGPVAPPSASATTHRREGSTRRGDDVEGRGLEADDLAASFYQDERIDLAQMVLEQIVLALPMKPLCQEDCRGLCPECGVNRNTTSCACVLEETDPRWATLKTLLGR